VPPRWLKGWMPLSRLPRRLLILLGSPRGASDRASRLGVLSQCGWRLPKCPFDSQPGCFLVVAVSARFLRWGEARRRGFARSQTGSSQSPTSPGGARPHHGNDLWFEGSHHSPRSSVLSGSPARARLSLQLNHAQTSL